MAEWQNKPLFYNRPPHFNTPVRIRGGFADSWGTQLVPVGLWYLQSLNVTEDNLDLQVAGVDSWGRYGDITAGTLTGLQDISDVLDHACEYVGIPAHKRYIDKVQRDYKKIDCLNTIQEEHLPKARGGYGEIWNRRGLNQFGDWWSMVSLSQAVQTDKAIYYAGQFKNQFLPDAYFALNAVSPGQGVIFNSDFALVEILPTSAEAPEVTTLSEQPNNFGEHTALGYFDDDNLLYFEYGFDWNDESQTGSIALFARSYNIPTNYTTFIGSFAGLFGSASYDWRKTGIFYDSNIGTGFLCAMDTGTAKMYRFNLDSGTDLVRDGNTLTWTGTTILQAGAGTNFNVTGAFMMPRPEDTYLGTNLYWYMFLGYEELATGTKNYLYKFGTETNTNGTFVEKVDLGDSFYDKDDDGTYGTFLSSGGYEYREGILHTVGHRITNKNRFIFWVGANEVFNIGHHGMKFQHNTIDTFGSIIKNTELFPAGSYTINTGTTQFYFNEFYTINEEFRAYYDIYGIQVNVGSLSTVTFKEAVIKSQLVAMYSSWFDGEGNFHFHSRDRVQKGFRVTDVDNRNFDNELVENPIKSNAKVDINKVKNIITVEGTNSLNQTIEDNTSKDIFGTRTLAKYTNSYISTEADTGTVAQMFREILAYPRYRVNCSIPFEPFLEVGDNFSYVDGVNQLNLETVIVKAISHDLRSFTTQITGEERPTQKAGEQL